MALGLPSEPCTSYFHADLEKNAVALEHILLRRNADGRFAPSLSYEFFLSRNRKAHSRATV